MEFIRYLYQKRRNVSLPILRVKCNNLMLRKRDFSLLIAITERSLWFYRSTIVISLSCRSKHDVNEGFFIIYNTFSYPGGQDRKWRAELLNWKCLQFYQPEIIILQNTRIVLVFSYVSQIIFFFSSLNNLIIFPKHAFSHSNNYWWKKQRECGIFMMQGQLSNVT